MEARSNKKARVLRREKVSPYADFWHTLLLGIPLAVALFLLLPLIFPLFID